MRLVLDTARKRILLKWLQQGYIETFDLPEGWREHSMFESLLMETGTIDEAERGDT